MDGDFLNPRQHYRRAHNLSSMSNCHVKIEEIEEEDVNQQRFFLMANGGYGSEFNLRNEHLQEKQKSGMYDISHGYNPSADL
jgi:hypothetical protein